jgi:tetratricopeptide (TPR) repeat protein
MKKLLLSCLLAIVAIGIASAQKPGYDPKVPYGHGEDSVKCLMNLSLLQTSVKASAFKDAVAPWTYTYENCPAASKNIYIYGPRIFKALYAQETDPAKKQALLDKVMEIYDTRLKYFGAEEGKSKIIAYKVYDYMELMGEKADSKFVYEGLKEAIEEAKDKMEPSDAYGYFMAASLVEYHKDNSKKEQYLNDYFTVTGYIDQAIANANAANDKQTADYLATVKEGIVAGFVSSGAGDCNTLLEYYGDKIEPNKNDKNFLNEVISSLSSVGCTESDLYFTAAEYLYKLEPSANAAVGLANRSLRNNDYDTAIKYYNEAANLETDKSKAADYLLQLAGIFSNQRNYSRARQAAYDALKYDPNNGKAYILIAQLYAASAGSIFQEPEKAGLVFCAAVDKLQKAKSVDPSVTAEANSLINKYAAYFMDTETAFMMGIKEGQSIFIPGWIGENTTVRLK